MQWWYTMLSSLLRVVIFTISNIHDINIDISISIKVVILLLPSIIISGNMYTDIKYYPLVNTDF